MFVVFRVHCGPETVDYDTVCGVFRSKSDAQACLGNEYRIVRPEDKWVASEKKPEDNDFMSAEVIQTDGELDRFGIAEKEVQ